MNSIKLLLPITLLSLLACAPAFANLGESPQEVEARYGVGKQSEKSRFPDTVEIKYETPVLEIFAFFMDGKSIKEQYKHHKGTMTNQEIEAFLRTVSPGKSWIYSRREKLWYIDNKKVIAHRESGHDDWLWIEYREPKGQAEKGKTLGF